MKNPSVKLSAVMVTDPKGRGYCGYFKEFPQALAFGKSVDVLHQNMLKSLEVLHEMNKENEASKKNNKSDIEIKETEFEFQLAS